MNPRDRTMHLSAFRGAKANNEPPDRPNLSGGAPVGPSGMTAGAQAGAIRNTQQPGPAPIPQGAKDLMNTGYQLGGFAGVSNAMGPQWYDTPEWARTSALAGLTGSTPAAPPAPAPAPAPVQPAPQNPIAGAYAAGGFDAVAKTPNWYDMPEFQRTKILSATGGL